MGVSKLDPSGHGDDDNPVQDLVDSNLLPPGLTIFGKGVRLRASGLEMMANAATFEQGMAKYECGNSLIALGAEITSTDATILVGAAQFAAGARAGLPGGGGRGPGGPSGPTKLYRILTDPTPEGNVISNAAKGLPPRGPEIGNAALHSGLSMFDTLDRAAAKVPVLEGAGRTVYGIGEFTPGPGITVVKTLGRGHYTVTEVFQTSCDPGHSRGLIGDGIGSECELERYF